MAGRVIAKKPTGRPAGRPKGSKDSIPRLRYSEKAANNALREAIAEWGEDDPVVKACLEKLVYIATADRLPRHVGDMYRAIVHLLDRREGKPRERQEHSGEVRHTVRIIEDDDGEA